MFSKPPVNNQNTIYTKENLILGEVFRDTKVRQEILDLHNRLLKYRAEMLIKLTKDNLAEFIELDTSIKEITKILTSADTVNSKLNSLVLFLHNRWARIKDTTFAYWRSPESPTSTFCHALAKGLKEQGKNSSAYKLLMDTLISTTDQIYGELDDLPRGKFALNTTSELPISFIIVANYLKAKKRMEANLDDYLRNFFAKGSLKNSMISLEELNLILHYSKESSDLNTWCEEYLSALKEPEISIGNALKMFAEELEEGGVKKNGEELQAGIESAKAVGKFEKYLKGLSNSQREELFKLHPGNAHKSKYNFGYIWWILDKPEESDAAGELLCVEIQAGRIKEIINTEEYKKFLFSETKVARLKHLNEQFELGLNNFEDCLAEDNKKFTIKCPTQLPKSYDHVFELLPKYIQDLSRDDQVTVFKVLQSFLSQSVVIRKIIQEGRMQVFELALTAGLDSNVLLNTIVDLLGNNQSIPFLDYIQKVLPYLDVKNINGETLLQWALTKLPGIPVNKWQELIDFIAKEYPQQFSDAIDEQGNTPLHKAIQNNDKDVIECLIHANIANNCKNVTGESPLHVAVKKNNKEAVELLLVNGAETTAIDYMQNTAAILAAKNGNKEILQSLIENNPKLCNKSNNLKNTPLLIACQNGSLECVQYLISKGCSLDKINSDGDMALTLAVKDNHFIIVSELIKAGADINASSGPDKTPLDYAIKDKNLSIIRLLLEKKVRVTKKQLQDLSPVLITAAQQSSSDIVRQLIELGVEVSVVTFLACKDKAVLSLLNTSKNKKLDPSKINKSLYEAIKIRQRSTVEILIDIGANINCKNEKGSSPLHFAVECNNDVAVNLLLSKGADVTAVDEGNNTAALLAAARGNHVLLTQLIQTNPQICNVPNKSGETPLTLASYLGHEACVKVLLENKVDTNFRNGSNLNAWELAKQRSHFNIANLLLAANNNLGMSVNNGKSSNNSRSSNTSKKNWSKDDFTERSEQMANIPSNSEYRDVYLYAQMVIEHACFLEPTLKPKLMGIRYRVDANRTMLDNDCMFIVIDNLPQTKMNEVAKVLQSYYVGESFAINRGMGVGTESCLEISYNTLCNKILPVIGQLENKPSKSLAKLEELPNTRFIIKC